jgi:hypothetical protein
MEVTKNVIDYTVRMCTIQGNKQCGEGRQRGTRRLAAATAARFPLGGGAASGPPWAPSRPPVSRPSPQSTPEGLPSPILRCLSRLREAALRFAARRSGGLPRRAEGTAIAAGEKGRRRGDARPGWGCENAVCFAYP